MNTPYSTQKKSPYMEAPDEILIQACPDSAWIVDRLELIDPHVFELGNDGANAYTRALELLVLQLRDELTIATGMVVAHAALTGSGCACRLKGQAYCEKHDS